MPVVLPESSKVRPIFFPLSPRTDPPSVPSRADKSLASSFGNLLSQPSVTVGAGLMYRHSLVRIEANVGVPLAMGKQEGGVKGLQFGLGLSFL
jgi:hypothetical protein